MLTNDFRQTIESGNVVHGARTKTFSPMMIEIYGELGLDFVWLDFEHAGPSPWDSKTIEELTRAADVANIELVMRIPKPDPALVRTGMDAGVKNILIPRVDTAEEVRTAVEAARYNYDGEPGQRGAASSRFNEYGKRNDYIQTADENTCVGIMIEKREIIENLQDVLSIPELGFIFIGPGDLSIQMGYPGEPDHPKVVETIESVVNASIESNIPVGGIAHDDKKAKKLIDDGYQIIRLGGDVDCVREVFNKRLAAVTEAKSE